MSAQSDQYYIDLEPGKKCIAIKSRHILIWKGRESDGSYVQGRPTNDNENTLIDLIVSLRATVEAQARQLDAAQLPVMIDNLNEIMDFVFKNEPCGYYCDEAVGHVDHKYTNWLRQIIGDLRTLASHAPSQPAPLCDVCQERPASVERDGHKFCGYCYGSYAATMHGEEFATPPAPEQGE